MMYHEFLKVVLWRSESLSPRQHAEVGLLLARKWRNSALGLFGVNAGIRRLDAISIIWDEDDYSVSLFGFTLGFNATRRELWFTLPTPVSGRLWHLRLPGHGDKE